MHLLTIVMLAFIFSEMDLLLVPYWADRELDLVQWPPFLLASKVLLFSFFFSFLKFLVSHLLHLSKRFYFFYNFALKEKLIFWCW